MASTTSSFSALSSLPNSVSISCNRNSAFFSNNIAFPTKPIYLNRLKSLSINKRNHFASGFQRTAQRNFKRSVRCDASSGRVTSCFVESQWLSVKPFCASLKRVQKITCSMNMSAQQSDDDHWKIKLGQYINKARKIWDSSPDPVKKFPWNKALDNFIQLVLDLTLAVVKYLSVPVFIITSISELSYCAHERKLSLVPFPVLFGVAVAGVLTETALELSPRLKEAEVPWHLVANAIFFTLIKLPGPYYPYWGRIIIPHFVNGILLRTLWFAIMWYKRPQKALKVSDSLANTYAHPELLRQSEYKF